MLMFLMFHASLVAQLSIGARSDRAQRDAAHDSVAVEKVAAEYAATKILNAAAHGHVALDSHDAFDRARSAARERELERILGAETAYRSDIISCSSGPSSCRLNHYAAVVRIRIDALTATSAEVSVMVIREDRSRRSPVWTYHPTLLLERQQHAWHFVRVLRVTQS